MPCTLALFLEMAQLSSYDSPDTPETDDSVEVKILCSCPSRGYGPCEAKSHELSVLEHLEEGARVVCTAQDVIQLLEVTRQEAESGLRAEPMLEPSFPKHIAPEKQACLLTFPLVFQGRGASLISKKAPCEEDFETIKLISNGAYG